MKRIIDASVAVKWFIEEANSDIALNVLGALVAQSDHFLSTQDGNPIQIQEKDDLVAPELVLIEVANVLRRKCNDRLIREDQAVETIRNLPRLFDHLVETSTLAEKALTLGIRLNHPALDCAYLACAEMVDGILITADEKFVAKCVKGGFQARIRGLAELRA